MHGQQVAVPPSSLAMTSALSSLVWAIELLELPKVMPITTRSAGSGPGLLPFSAIVSLYSSARVQVVQDRDRKTCGGK